MEAAAEKILVDAARIQPPQQLAGVGRRILDTVDPDGTLASDVEQRRRCYVALHQQPDGMVKLDGLLTVETAAAFTAVLNVVAASRTSTDNEDKTIPDDRVWAQRAHDGLLDLRIPPPELRTTPWVQRVVATPDDERCC